MLIWLQGAPSLDDIVDRLETAEFRAKFLAYLNSIMVDDFTQLKESISDPAGDLGDDAHPIDADELGNYKLAQGPDVTLVRSPAEPASQKAHDGHATAASSDSVTEQKDKNQTTASSLDSFTEMNSDEEDDDVVVAPSVKRTRGLKRLQRSGPKPLHPAMCLPPAAADGNGLSRTELYKDAIKLARAVQVHRHTFSCYKNVRRGEPLVCRYAFPKRIVKNEFVDEQTRAVYLRRLNAITNTFNVHMLVALRCNMDLKFIASNKDAKALIFYITDYITKGGLSSYNYLTLLKGVIEELEAGTSHAGTKYRQIADAIDRSRRLLIRCHNQVQSQQELSAQQVISYLMKWPDHFKSHEFAPLFWADIERVARLGTEEAAAEEEEALSDSENDSDDDGDTDETLGQSETFNLSMITAIDEHEGVEVTSGDSVFSVANQRVDYQLRNDKLEDLHLHDFVSEFKSAPKVKRPIYQRYAFANDHPRAGTHESMQLPFAKVPVLVGPAVPAVPEDDDPQEVKDAYARAVLLLFCPWRDISDLKAPGQSWHDAWMQYKNLLEERAAGLADVAQVSILPWIPPGFELVPSSQLPISGNLIIRRRGPRWQLCLVQEHKYARRFVVRADVHGEETCLLAGEDYYKTTLTNPPPPTTTSTASSDSLTDNISPAAFCAACGLSMSGSFMPTQCTGAQRHPLHQGCMARLKATRDRCPRCPAPVPTPVADAHAASWCLLRQSHSTEATTAVFERYASHPPAEQILADEQLGDLERARRASRTLQVLRNIQQLNVCKAARDKDMALRRERVRAGKKLRDPGDIPDSERTLPMDGKTKQRGALLSEFVRQGREAAKTTGWYHGDARVPPPQATAAVAHVPFRFAAGSELNDPKGDKIKEKIQQARKQRMIEMTQPQKRYQLPPESFFEDKPAGEKEWYVELAKIVDNGPSQAYKDIANELAAHFGLDKFENQRLAFDVICEHAEGTRTDVAQEQLLMYLGGPGGTGKSRVIEAVLAFFEARGIRHEARVGAYTGSAAALIGGSTIDSLLCVGRGDTASAKNTAGTAETLELTWRGVKYFIIDEVSLLSCQKLHQIHARLCQAKRTGAEEPFGKVNMIWAGDFLQLPAMGGTSLFRSQRTIPCAPDVDASAQEKDVYAKAMLTMFAPSVLQQTWLAQRDWLYEQQLSTSLSRAVVDGEKTWWQLFEENVDHFDAHARALMRRAAQQSAKKEKERIAEEKRQANKKAAKEKAAKADAAEDDRAAATSTPTEKTTATDSSDSLTETTMKAKRRKTTGPGLKNVKDATASEHDFKRGSGRVLWLQVNEVVILTEQVRCTDEGYAALLARCRLGNCTAADIAELRKHVLGEGKPAVPDADGEFSTGVVTRNGLRTGLNDSAVNYVAHRQGATIVSWEALDRSSGAPVREPARSNLLELPDNETDSLPGVIRCVPGMRVMLTKNIAPELGLCNGTNGRLVSLVLDPKGGMGTLSATGDRTLPCLPLYALVEVTNVRIPFDVGFGTNIVPVLPDSATFQTTLYYDDDKGRATSSEHSINRTQLPFIPLYAMTDYKSQGQTLQKATVDIARPPTPNFNHSRAVYVMLSRLKSRAGLSILREFEDDVLTQGVDAELALELYRLDCLFERTRHRHRSDPAHRERLLITRTAVHRQAAERAAEARQREILQYDLRQLDKAQREAAATAARKTQSPTRGGAAPVVRSYPYELSSCHLDTFLESVWAARHHLTDQLAACPKPPPPPPPAGDSIPTIEEVRAFISSSEIGDDDDVSALVLLLVWHRQKTGVASRLLRNAFRDRVCGIRWTTPAIHLFLHSAISARALETCPKPRNESRSVQDMLELVRKFPIANPRELSLSLMACRSEAATLAVLQANPDVLQLLATFRWWAAQGAVDPEQCATVYDLFRARVCSSVVRLASFCESREGNIVGWVKCCPSLFGVCGTETRGCALHGQRHVPRCESVHRVEVPQDQTEVDAVHAHFTYAFRSTPTEMCALNVELPDGNGYVQCDTLARYSYEVQHSPPLLAIAYDRLESYPLSINIKRLRSAYALVSATRYRANPRHYVCYTKDHNRWTYYNDLNDTVVRHGQSFPPQPVHEHDVAIYARQQ